MSDLVLMMWLVDVVSVSDIIGIIGRLLASTLVAWIALQAYKKYEGDDDFPSPPKSLIALCVALCLTAWLMPSKQTLYAAIAIKAGHEIAESRIGSKAVTALEGVLDEVIAKQKKGEK